jgi:hypothetical protein
VRLGTRRGDRQSGSSRQRREPVNDPAAEHAARPDLDGTRQDTLAADPAWVSEDAAGADPPALTVPAGPGFQAAPSAVPGTTPPPAEAPAGTGAPTTTEAPAGTEAPTTTEAPATRRAGAPGWLGYGRRLAEAGWVRQVGRWLRPLGSGISRWWQATDLAGRSFALVTVLPSLLLVAWLVPGIALLLAGRFLPVPMLLIAVPVAVALIMLCARDIPGRWPAAGRRGDSHGSSWGAWWGLGGTVAVAAVFAAWQLAVNSPQLVVSREPGAYLQFGYWLAEHGSLPIPVSLAAFGGTHPGLTFSSFGFTGHGSALAPQFMAGLPITLSAGLWAHGIPGAVVVSPVLGALAVLSAGGLVGRLAGPQWAPLGAVLLALTVPEVYTSRSAFSETLVQALLFGGLCLVVDSLFTKRPLMLSATGGAVLGLTTLAWSGSILAMLPLILFGTALLAGRRSQGIPFAAGVVGGAALGIGSGAVFAVPLASGTGASWREIIYVAAGFLAVAAAGAAVALIPPVRQRAARLLAARPLRWLPEAGAAAVVALAVMFAVRPSFQTVRGPASRYVAELQRLTGLRVDPTRLYAERSLYWVVWYLGLPALLLGVIGLAIVTRRCLRALLRWRDDSGVARAWALPAAVILWGFLTVLWHPATLPDHPWASRRLVPVVLPGLIVAAVWVSSWLITRAQARGAGAVAVGTATACFVAALTLPPAAITFEIAPLLHATTPGVRLALTGLAFRRTGAGEYTADLQLCGAIGQRSAVLLLDQPAAREFGPVIRGLCGVPAGLMPHANAAQVQGVIAGIERAGRRPVLLATQARELLPYQAHPQQIMNLLTQQDTHVLIQPPTSTWPVNYTLWMSAPAATAGGS